MSGELKVHLERGTQNKFGIRLKNRWDWSVEGTTKNKSGKWKEDLFFPLSLTCKRLYSLLNGRLIFEKNMGMKRN